MKLKKILVPTDFSKNALHAAYFAADIAKKVNASVTLLNAYHRPQGSAAMMVNIDDQLADNSKRDCQAQIKEIKQKYPDIVCEGKSLYGYVNEAINTLTQNKEFDLIIMGTTGSDGIKNKLLGSNTSQMLKASNTPLMSIPQNFDNQELKKIILATELPIENMKALDQFIEISELLGATTEIVTLATQETKKETEELVANFKKISNKKITVIEEEKDFASALTQYSEDNNVGAIGMLKKEYGFFEELFHKSKIKKMALSYKKPLLVIDANE